MSFILDALRKSEHERQRQTGPALVETPVVTPKPKSNVWATAAIALLVVNLVAIGLLLLYKSRDEPVVSTAADAEQPARVDAAPSTAARPTATPATQPAVTQTLPQPAGPPPMLRPATDAPAVAGSRNPLEGEISSGGPSMDYEAAERAAEPPPGPPAVVPIQRGSVVYDSLPGGEPVDAQGYGSRAQRSTSNLPTADEFAARAGLPEMRLELHVYSTNPQQRFVFINGRKYQQGDSTQEGATVDEVTPDGVILNARGNRFLLPRD
jgi:general secretion pathway protein B